MLTPDDARARSQRRRPRSLRRLTSFFRRKSPDATAGADQTGARSTIPNAVSSSAPAPVVHRSCPGDPPATLVDDSPALVSDDIWSAAFRQAVASFQQETGTAIPEGQSLAHMFGALEGLDSNATHEDAIKQGVEKLRAIQGPLENFKMVLDLASPLTSLEPITMTVFGVVRSVTMIGIGIANADVDFAKQIKDMLRRLQCINDCDTLGQKTNRSHIHETLVLVYREILTFYTVVLDILTTKGIKLWVKLAQELQNQRVPEIVQEISHLTENLHDAIQLAISGLVVNINDRLTSMEIDRLFDTEELRLQESYRKELQDSRRKGGSGTNRTSRGDQACQFMLTDATFLDWLSNFSETANLFAIIGHMGSGKSVLVSFLIEELKRRNRGQIPEPKVCNYYCRDARPGLENRVYSVLLFQLLEQLPWLKEPFLKWYKKEVESGNHPLEDASILEDYLDALCGLLERPLFLVIDGVDECDPDTCRSIITLLRRLSKGNLNVKILLSCRPSQEIVKQLELMLQVHLVASDERDRLIVEHTVHKRLESLSDEVKNEIVRAVSSAAQGSAIWTRMTIESIVKEEITQLRPILSFLQNMSLPGGLADLYKNLLPPATDAVGSRKRKTATVALMILYAARRPLSISELGWATALGTAPQDTTAVSALAVLVDAPRILRLIRPFLAPIDFDDLTKRQIFLVHKSVEEFVLEIVKPPHQHPEKCIFDICVRYLLLDEIGHFHLFSEEQILSSELRQATDLFADSLSGTQEYNEDCDWDEWEADETRFDPTESRAGAEHGFGHFFVYASCHWVDHLGALDLEDLARTDDIERLCHVGSTRLRNWIEQHRRPDCVLQPRFTFDYSLYDPLSIVALFGSDAVFADMLATSDFKSSSYSAETIENAAAQLRQWGGKTQVTRSRGRVQARQFGSQGRIAALEDAVLRQAS